LDSAFPCNSSTEEKLSLKELEDLAEDWLLQGEAKSLSTQTLTNRKLYLHNLFWFFQREGYVCIGRGELRCFFAYIPKGHLAPEGRWGNPKENTPVKPVTVKTYYCHIRTFYRWLVKQEYLSKSPMEKIDPPIARENTVQPFTEAQVNALLKAAEGSLHPKRDTAILYFLLDTGARVAELCALKMKDVDLSSGKVTVQGKGNKSRPLYLSKSTLYHLRTYLRREQRGENDFLFYSNRGAFTPHGVQQLIERLGGAAGIQGARCSPHTFRHTFAVTFLRNGGNQFSLMQLLGHTDLRMTARYVTLAQADLENQHRAYSPVESIVKIRKR
jgi:site-specific recombinase XerD